MSFLQAHQVLTYESAEIRVLGFLGKVGMTTPEDPGKYSRLCGAEPNRFVSGEVLFYLLGYCAISKDRQKKKPIASTPDWERATDNRDRSMQQASTV